MFKSGNGITKSDKKSSDPWTLISRERKILITFYKKYLKPDEPDFNIILFICSSDVVSIDNLPPDLAYF